MSEMTTMLAHLQDIREYLERNMTAFDREMAEVEETILQLETCVMRAGEDE